MRTGRLKAELVLTGEERLQPKSFARGRSLSAASSNHARLVLASAEGEANNAIDARLEPTTQTVGRWRTRFIERRIAGLYEDIPPGPARTIDYERVTHLIKTTLHIKPANGSTHWSVRAVAAEAGISKSNVRRYLQLFGLQPHRPPELQAVQRPVLHREAARCGWLYLSPPDNALVTAWTRKANARRWSACSRCCP
jgi:putative transposase